MKEIFYIIVYTLSAFQTVPCSSPFVTDSIEIDEQLICRMEVKDTIYWNPTERELEKYNKEIICTWVLPKFLSMIRVNGAQQDTLIWEGNHYSSD